MAPAVVDRPREKERGYDLDAVQRDALAVTLVDLEGNCASAVSPGRRRHGLAGATHVAAAIFDVAPFDGPRFACHDSPPNQRGRPNPRPVAKVAKSTVDGQPPSSSRFVVVPQCSDYHPNPPRKQQQTRTSTEPRAIADKFLNEHECSE